MPPLNSDTDLLARLNALKASSVDLSGRSNDSDDPEDDLAARFLRFGNGGAARQHPDPVTDDSAEKNLEDDRTIEELLADIGPEDQWILDPDEPEHIARLMDEAKASLKDDVEVAGQDHDQADDGDDQESSLRDATDAHGDLANEVHAEADSSLKDAANLQIAAAASSTESADRKEEEITQDEEADAALQQILDELSLENALVNRDLDSNNDKGIIAADPEKKTDGTENKLDSVLYLPSAPSQFPSRADPGNKALESGLDLPTAPMGKPDRKVTKSNLPTYTDIEIDSWCIICNDDAAVSCKGCDGDLYCLKCWREGHTGPDVGYEEKSHQWVKYNKPK